MGGEIGNRVTRKLLLGGASALALSVALTQEVAAAPCGSGSDTTIAAACTAPFDWTGGNLTVTSLGTISGTGYGVGVASGSVGEFNNLGVVSASSMIYGLRLSAGASIAKLTNNGKIVGRNSAVYAAGSIGALTNTGLLDSMGAGVSTNASGVIGTIDNQAGATINGQWALYNSGHVGTFTNAGTLTISRIGINNRAGGIIDVIENTGFINSSDRGIQNLTSIGSIFNSGTIIGGTGVVGTGIGINTPSGTIGTITNQGFISGIAPGLVGGQGSGIHVGGFVMEISNSGTIEGNRAGLAVRNFSTSKIDRVINTGTIRSTGLHGGVDNYGTIESLINDGLITGSTYALVNVGSMQLVNAGIIAGNIDNTGTLTISGGSGGTVGTLTGFNGSIGAFGGSELVFDTGALLLNDVITDGVVVVGTGGTLINTGTIGTISGLSVQTGASLAALTNSGEISGGGTFSLYNEGSIGTLTNNGLITSDSFGLGNKGTLTELHNTGSIVSTGGGGWSAGIANGGVIGTIDNRGLISGAGSSAAAVYNLTGTISVLANSGTIAGLSGGAAILSTGNIGTISNSGVISGDIQSNSGLIFAGGTATGTLTGGTITAPSVEFISGSHLLQDDIVGNATVSGATLTVGAGERLTGAYSQSSGILDLSAIGTWTIAGTAHISGGTVIAGSLSSTGNYMAGDLVATLIDADSGSSYSGFIVQFSGLSGIAAGADMSSTDDLRLVYLNDYIGGNMPTLTNNGTITGGDNGVVVGSSGSIGTFSNDGTIGGGGSGVLVGSGGTIGAFGNTGPIVGGDTGLLIDTGGGIGTLNNSGSIGGGDYGLMLGSGGSIGGFSNDGSILGGDYGIFIGTGGNVGSFSNSGTLGGGEDAFYNGGTIGTFENNGQIVDGTGLANVGSIGILTNNGAISGGNGLANFGTIDVVTNAASGVISGTTNAGIYNTGSLGQLTNSGLITGPVFAIDNSGSLGPIANSGTITGNIRSTSPLAISGGTGATYGVLTGGTITADVNFTSGNLRLADNIVGNASLTGAQLETAATLSITGAYSQTAGTLILGANKLTVSGTANISGGTVTADLPAAANYLVGQSITLIDAAAGSSYAGATVALAPITGLAASANTASSEDLALTFGNDYIGASLASLTNTGTLSGSAYGVYVASTGTLGALANAGTIRGTQYAIYSAGSLGTITNTGLISGNIHSAGVLAFAGTGGTLSGGTITATGVSIAGSLRLADAINVGSGTVGAGTASVELSSKISITGNYLQTGGVLISDVADTATYGALGVSGSATITNTTITVNGTSVKAGQNYTIVDAGAASSYTGDTIKLVGAHYRADLSTVGDDLIASIKPLFGEIGAAKGGAAAVMGGVLDKLSNDTALQPMIDRLSLLSDGDLGRALEQAAPADVGGEVASLQRASLIEDLIGTAVSSHAHSAAPGWSVWQEVLGGTAKRTAASGGYDTTAAGLVLGVDNRIRENLLIGAALSWSAGWNAGRGDVSGHANGMNSFALTGYGSWTRGALTVNGRVAAGLDHYKQHRTVTSLNEKAEADYSGQHYVIAADGSYDFHLAPGVTLSPQASLRWLRLAADSYSETGVGPLTVGSVIADQVQSGLGAKLAMNIDTRFGLVVPEFRAGWLHDFVNGPGETNAVLGGLSFTTTSARISADGVRIGTGLTFYQSDATSLRLEYDGEFRDDYTAHGGMLQLSLKL